MSKKSKTKKVLKIIGGIAVFFTLPTLLLFGFLYFKYNEELPTGKQGVEADALATKMLNSLDVEAYEATEYLEWTFMGRHHYKWYKSENRCEVYWRDFKVVLDLKKSNNSIVYVANQTYNGNEKQKYIDKAIAYFNNDSFWLIAPYKVFENNVERRLVYTKDNKKALLVTYTSGGSTPGDSYLWHFDETGKPKSYQMWVSILPISGLKATWEKWIITKSGAQLPTFHKLLVLGLDIGNIKNTKTNYPLK